MQRTLRRYTTAAAAIAGAALVAAIPAAIKTIQLQHPAVRLVDVSSAAADPADVSQDIANLGQSEITTGQALYNQGDWAAGLSSILNGENNLYIASPQDALLEQIETPSQPYEYVFFDPTKGLPIPTDSSQLSADLQQITEIGQNLVNQGSSDLAAGLTNLGLGETYEGYGDLTVVLPQYELYGPMFISFATSGNLADPASYGADGSLHYLADAVNDVVVGPISTFAEVAGIDLGPVGDLLGAAGAIETVNAFTDHWDGYLAGNPVDATHILVETPELLFTAAGAMTAEDPPISIGLDAIATGFGGLDTLVTDWLGAG